MNHTAIYSADAVRRWERWWFNQNNSPYGLMRQAALLMAQRILDIITPASSVNVWCGKGNNGGDGLLIAKYLQGAGHDMRVILPDVPTSDSAKCAYDELRQAGVAVIDDWCLAPIADVQIDALFGIGLDKPLDDTYQKIIKAFNNSIGLKIAIDLPSGLCADTGTPLPMCVKADHTLCVLGRKLGLYGAISKSVVGEITLISLIPAHDDIRPAAYLTDTPPRLADRNTNAHKGDFGSVMVIGGHAKMGGAVIMAGEAAMAVGAGRTTILTHNHHHTAILSRSPNLMLGDINDDGELTKLSAMTAVCFGMGLGRDDWALKTFKRIFSKLRTDMAHKSVVLDADALWHLANYPLTERLPSCWILTPHSAEAAKLLATDVQAIENNRFSAIRQLQDKFGGQWVLKGANTLTLDAQGRLQICALGNAGMATAGMGDVLSGMMAGIFAQFPNSSPMTTVALHAHAGDILAKNGKRGLSAHDMPHAIRQAVNP